MATGRAAASKSVSTLGRAAASESVSSEVEHYVSRGVSYMPVRHSPFTKLINYVNSLRDSIELYDLEIKSRGQVFQVHRLVLAGSSPYFRNALTSQKALSVLSVDFDPDLLSLCLDYMYKGSVDVDVRMAGPLKDICEILGMDDLMNDFSRYQLSQLDLEVENCIEIWDVACCVEDKVRAQKAISIVLDNLEDLMTSPSYLGLSYERVNHILSHPDLKVSSPDVRLSSVLEWVRHDPNSRTKYLLPLLNVFPLNKISTNFLKYILRAEHMLQSHSKARVLVQDAIIEKQAKHVIFIVGVCPYKGDGEQPAVQEVYAMPTSLTAPSQPITTLPSTIHEDGCVAVSVNERQVTVSGLGKKLNEVWLYDHKKRVWCGGGVLRRPRVAHCMIEMNGDLYVMGGTPDPSNFNIGDCVEVEMRVSGTDFWQAAGSLVGSRGGNTQCCQLGDSDILVGGVWDKDDHVTLQVYSTVSHSVTCTLSLPDGWHPVYGLVVAGDHAIVMRRDNTYICPVTSLRKGKSQDIQIRPAYKTPNRLCAVVLTEDKRHIVLVGGDPRDMTSAHYTYRARVVDIVDGAGTGWVRVESGWTVGRCDVVGGVCTGMLPASVMK